MAGEHTPAAYATLSDLQAGWRALSPVEQGIAQALLDRVAVLIDEAFENAGKDPADMSETKRRVAGIISCDLVQYSMDKLRLGNTDLMDDSISDQVWQSDASGSGVRLNDDQLRRLGVGRTHAGWALP